MRTANLALLASIAVTTCPATAQTPGCEPEWQVANAIPGFEAPTCATAWDPDGPGPQPEVLVVGGARGVAGAAAHDGLATFDPSTGTWSSLPTPLNQPSTQFVVGAVARDSLGRLLVAANRRVYRLDNGSWVTLGVFVSATNYAIARIEPLPGGGFVAAGTFSSVNGTPAASVVRFDGAAWQPFGGGITGAIQGVHATPSGDLLVAGVFSAAGGLPADGLARWNGAQWTVLPTPPSNASPGFYTDIAELANGDVVTVNAATGSGIFRWDGQQWDKLGGTTTEAVRALAVRPNGDLVVAGDYFTSIAGVAARFVARWDGAQWWPLGGGIDRAGISRFTEMSNGDLVAIGRFTAAGGEAAVGVARWDGADWHAFGEGFNHGVLCLERLPSGDLVCGGLFTGRATATTPANGIARFDGAQWWPFADGLDGAVREVVVMPNGDLVAVGHFLGSGATPMRGVARWDGAAWQPLGVSGTDGPVHDAVVLPNGDLVIAGFFAQVDGVPALRIARWDGAQWHALGAGLNGAAESLVVDATGGLVVGGLFSAAGGAAANGIARWDGAAWQALGAGTGLTRAVALDADELLLAFGSPDVQRWDGSAWTVLGANVPAFVKDAIVMPNGDLVAVSAGLGNPSVSGQTGGVTRWPASGSPSPLFGTVDGPVYDVIHEPDGSLLVCGQFRAHDAGLFTTGTPSPYLARIASPCPATTTSYGSGCIGAGGPLNLAPVEVPWLGATARARCTGLPTNSIAVALVSLQPILNAGPIPMAASPTCSLWVANPIADIVQHTNGVADATLAIPTTTALVGLSFYQQVVSVELSPNGAVTGLASSNGLRQTIGAF